MASRGSPGHSLSKERLKNELVAHGLPLPPSGSKKEVYVEMYEKNVVSNAARNPRSEFSSDEEERSPILHHKIRKSVFTSVNHEDDDDSISLVVGGINIAELSDDELRDRLLDLKAKVGPIVDTTRQVYERKLARLMRGEVDGEVSHRRYEDEEFSDSDDDTASRHSSTPITTRNRGSPKSNDFIAPSAFTDVRKRTSGESAPSTNLSIHDDISAFRRTDFDRDTPTPRRSLRSDISYTPVDRSKYPNLLQSQNNLLNSNKDANSVSSSSSNLVSKVVEQVDEPEPLKPSRKYILWIVLFAIIFVILGILVYQNMEGSTSDHIDNIADNDLPVDTAN